MKLRFRLLLFCTLSLGLARQLPAQVGPAEAADALPRLPAEEESWLGQYAGKGIELEFRATVFGLTAVLRVNGATQVGNPRVQGNRVTGTFGVGANAVPFEVTRQGNRLRLVSGSREFLLERKDTGSANTAAPANEVASPPPPAGKRVEFNLGCSIVLPDGWTSQETSEGVMLLPAGVRFDPNRNDNLEVYVLSVRDDYDPREEAQVAEQLSAAVAQNGGRGGRREPLTFGRRQGAAYRWEFRDPQSGRPAAMDVFLAAEGRKVAVVLAAGERGHVRAQDAVVRQILSSVNFTAPAAADPNEPLADNTPLAQRWLAKLRGKLVRQFWASQGMSSDKRHWLAADGTYTFKSASMVSVDVSGASGLSTGRDDTTGRWRLRDVSGQIYLEVRLNNGDVKRMQITEDNRNWYLNGEKAFAVDP